MSIDRRQFKRFETLLIVEIGPQKESTSYYFGITKNVSFEGFIFESQNYDLRPGDILEFRLKHPQSKLSVPVIGKIVWNRETKFECHSGIKFYRFDNETKSKVFELISADTPEHSGHVSLRDEVRSVRTGQSDSHIGAPLPVSAGKHKDDMRDESSAGGDPGDTVNSGQEPEARKEEGTLIQGNVSRTANGSIASRRKEHKKRRSYTLIAAVFLGLIIASALMVFMSGIMREKTLPPELSTTVINNTDSVSQAGGTPAMNETGAFEPPAATAVQSAFLTDYDKQTAGEEVVTESGKPLDQNGYEELDDHDYGGTAEQLTPLQMTDETVVAQNKKVLLQEAEREPDKPVVLPQDRSAREQDKISPDHTVLKDSEAKKINKANAEDPVRKKDEVQKIVQKIRATVKEESRPVSLSAKEKRAEKPVSTEEKKSMQPAPVQDRSKTASSKITDTVNKMTEPKNDEAVIQKGIALQKPDRASKDATKSLKALSTKDKEKGKEIQIAKNVAGNEEKKSDRAVESVKKSKTGVENGPLINKASTSARQTPAETSIVNKDAAKINAAESVVINNKPERKVPLTRSEPKIHDVSKVSKQGRSKKPADTDRSPKIALVLLGTQSKISDVKNKQPEITDEYLSKYYTAYTDFFNDNANNWDIFDIGAASARIEDGLYHIENKKQGGSLIVLHYQQFPHDSDFVLEMGIRAIKGLDRNAYGIIFGAKDARDNYSFQIRENKFYSVKNYSNGVPGYLTSGEIKGLFVDKKSAVLMRIVKQADGIKFYINSEFVDKVANLEFHGNQIGFIVEGKSHIAIDYTRSYIRKADHDNAN